MPELTGGLVAATFVAIHVWAGRLQFLGRAPRSVWLSLAGGISVGYVFLHLLPELHEGQRHADTQASAWSRFIENEIYLMALAGLTAFYGLERLAIAARQSSRNAERGDHTSPTVFWIHIGSFALYNVLVGYLLVRGERDNLVFYALAMGLHFLVNDHGLRAHHKHRYDGIGRWVLAAAVLAGWMFGLRVGMEPGTVNLLVAVLSGAIVLNVLKEELPEQRESRFWAFFAGVVLYGGLLLGV
jgi:hypothetical protein